MTTIRLYQFFEGFDISGAVYNFVMKIDSTVEAIKTAFATWNKRITGRRELNRLSDRLLEDIGITRFDVSVEAGKFFWQK